MRTDEQEGWDDMKQTLQIWRREHSNATFAEMEQAVEEDLARLRSQILTFSPGRDPGRAPR